MREGWINKRFDEVFDLQMGKTPDRKNLDYFGGNNVWVSIRDLGEKEIYESHEYITDVAVADTNIKIVLKGTVVMSFKLTVGKCGIASRDLYTNEAIMAFNVKNGFELDSSFLYYYLQGYQWEGANKAVMGITLNKATISKHIISIPPIPLQQSIVAELDEINNLLSLKRKELETYDKLAQSLFYEMFGDPVENEKGWEVKKYGDEFEIGSGGTPSKAKPEFWEGGEIPWIGSNMCQNCIVNETDGKYITAEGLSHSSAKLLDKGTVLVALVGATIGRVALLKTSTSTNQNIAFIKVPNNEDYNSYFVFYHMMSLYEEFMNIGNGDFKMANLSFVRSLPIIKPSLDLQQTFANRIEAIEKQKANVKAAIEKLETLLAARMQYWFD